MKAAATAPLPGAVKTELAAGRIGADGLEPCSAAEWAALNVPWETFAAAARKNAVADLAGLKPRFERDRRGSILYAELRAERPIVAAAVLAPDFLEKWADTLGEKVVVVVPNRSVAYIFPRLASEWPAYAPMALRAYRETAHPVSVEVFEVGPEGWRCLGAYEAP